MNKTSNLLNIIDTINVADPCAVGWNTMTGDDRRRHCSLCSLTVHNISSLTTTEAIDLCSNANKRVCIQFHRRSDGIVRTSDRPELKTNRFRRLLQLIFVDAVSMLTLSFATVLKDPGQPSQPDDSDNNDNDHLDNDQRDDQEWEQITGLLTPIEDDQSYPEPEEEPLD